MVYLIHQGGKVASQTLEATIAASDPSATIERHHFLMQHNLDVIDRICDRMRPGPHVDQQRGQNVVARAAMATLARHDPRSVWILTGFRDPLDHVISKFFQNISEYYPSYSSPAADERYDAARFDVEVDRTIEFFIRQVTSYLKRQRDVALAEKLEVFWDIRYALHLDEWFELEFKPAHGVDLYGVEIGAERFVRFSTPAGNFLVYRMETLKASLPRLLEALPLPNSPRLVNLNVGTEKDYAVLYRRFRERFTPTPEMVAYYYGGRFFRHFYSGSTPLYSEPRHAPPIAIQR